MRAGLWPSKEKFTSSTPKLSAHSPKAASAPWAPPLKRMTSSRRITGALFLLFLRVVDGFGGVGGVRRVDGRIVVLHEVRRDVDGVFILGAVEVIHAAGELGRDGAARLVLVLLEGFLFVLRRSRGAKVFLPRVAGAALGMSRTGRAVPAAGARTAKAAAARKPAAAREPAATAGISAGTRRAIPAASWRAAGAAIFARPRLADGERPTHEQLAVEFLDRVLGHRSLGVLDEREAARAAGFTIEGTHDLRRLTDLREVCTQVVFGCLIGQIAHEQSDWWHGAL